MKRKLTILGLGVLAVAAAWAVFLGREGQRRSQAPARIQVETQGSRLTLVPQPNGYATWRVIASLPRSNSIASSPATGRKGN